MRPAHPTERAIGIDQYVSNADGIGGRLRARPEAFRVEELERFDTEPVDADPGPYPHVVFRAKLRDWETNEFASALSDQLGISRERVSWAGTKDKRAVTTQLFSVQGVDPARIEAIDSDALDGASLSVLGRAGRAIEFGDLAGNRFEITVTDASGIDRIADVTADLAAFAGAVDSAEGFDPADPADGTDATESTDRTDATDHTATIGVPNFFGQQRFGSLRPITHEVGLAVVRGEWEEAVRTYVAEPYESEPDDTRAAREVAGDAIEDRDWSRALDALPHRLGYERSMVHSLAEESESGPGAVDSAAFRTALEAVPSSLQRLFVHAAQSYAFNRILSERIDRGLPFDEPVEGDVACVADRDAPEGLRLPDVDRSQRVTGSRVGSIAKHCKRGRAFVTAPLVGTETELGNGTQGEIERSVLDDLELSPGDFDLPGDWASTGTRRAMLVTTELTVQGDPPTFEFALPKGAYATVVLREYLKVDPVDLG